MLADLQNSDFISWKENIMFLDNAWTELYQKIINRGDKTFLQEFSFTGSRTYLPDDFYQLYYVCYTDGQYERPINRKAKTSTGQGPYYDIVNNELIIYRDNVNSLNKIVVRYYPTKNAITYRADTRTLETQNLYEYTTLGIVDVADKYALTRSGSILDMINDTIYKTGVTGDIIYMESGEPKTASMPNPVSMRSICKMNNKLYTISSTNHGTVSRLTITKTNGPKIAEYDVNAATAVRLIEASGIKTFVNDVVYFVENSILYAWDLKSDVISVYAENVTSSNIVSFNGHIYYETNEGVFRDNELVIDINEYDIYNGTMKADLQTGYGILTDNKFLFGSFSNTELDFPNNFYYNYLAYKLAVYYKIKQNADPTSLMAALAEAETTLYNTMPRDENNFVRIANSYAY